LLKVFSSEDRFLVTHIHALLSQQGIPCFVKNEYAIGAMGDLSPFDCWPEVWVTDDEWLSRAKKIIQQYQQQSLEKREWFCGGCGEKNEASFEFCWQCGRDPF